MPNLGKGKIYVSQHILHRNMWSDIDVKEENGKVTKRECCSLARRNRTNRRAADATHIVRVSGD